MRESDYIAATNAARCVIILSALRDLTPCDEVPESALDDVIRTITGWKDASFAVVNHDDEEGA